MGQKQQGLMHDVTTRFMGLIVLAMGVQFALAGLKTFFAAWITRGQKTMMPRIYPSHLHRNVSQKRPFPASKTDPFALL